MNLRLRRKYFNILGVVGATIQLTRYSFDLLGDYRIEAGAFVAFVAMGVNIKGLGNAILSLFKRNNNNAL